MFLVAGNMAMYGGGMKIAPEADPTDGILDICIVKRMSKFILLKLFLKYLRDSTLATHSLSISR